jgi:hypothetical protein
VGTEEVYTPGGLHKRARDFRDKPPSAPRISAMIANAAMHCKGGRRFSDLCTSKPE